jgi:1,2-dihydroxy-3-keto-5-methylthiopentene dioxygenase
MAMLRLEDGTIFTQTEEIARELAQLKVNLARWSVGSNGELPPLLAKEALEDEEKEQVLQALDGYFEQLKQDAGYQSRDLIVLHPNIPNLDAMLSKFERIHTHADDEVRYIIDGEGVFGFVKADGTQLELTIEAEEYIHVPAGTEHWFYLTPKRRIKAVRYFTSTEGWTPEYTGTPVRLHALNF